MVGSSGGGVPAGTGGVPVVRPRPLSAPAGTAPQTTTAAGLHATSVRPTSIGGAPRPIFPAAGATLVASSLPSGPPPGAVYPAPDATLEASALPSGGPPDAVLPTDTVPPRTLGGRLAEEQRRAFVRVPSASAAPFLHPLLNWDDSCSEEASSVGNPEAESSAAETEETAPPPEPSPPCGLCPQYDSGDMSPLPMIAVRVRRSSYGRRPKQVMVHQECAEWAPEAYWQTEDKLVNVDAAYARGRRLRCSVCQTWGATIGCYVESCRRTFHYRCLKLGRCKVDDTAYAVYCEAHADIPTPAMFRSVTGAWACRVPEE